jgi:hypothetical protein
MGTTGAGASPVLPSSSTAALAAATHQQRSVSLPDMSSYAVQQE